MDMNNYDNAKYKPYLLDSLGVDQEVIVKSHEQAEAPGPDMQWGNTHSHSYQTDEPKVIYLNEYIVKHSLVDKEKIVCTMCNIEFPSTKLAKKHSKTHSQPPATGYTDNTKSKTHYQKYEYPVGMIEFVDANSETRSAENKSKPAQRAKTVTCDICYKSFAQPAHLTNHLLVHTGVRNFSCQYCDKKFKQRGHVLNHQKIHLGEKNYKCGECGKSFRQTAHLRTHAKIHTGVKDHVCILCSKVFTQSGQLQTHMRTHTNERKYECHMCNMKFKQSGHLQSHVKRHVKRMSKETEMEHTDEEEDLKDEEVQYEDVDEEDEIKQEMEEDDSDEEP